MGISTPFPHRQIVGLDLLRFLAACLVLFFHLGYNIWAGPPETTTRRAAGSLIQFHELDFFKIGRLGVDIFFVISGFIIAYSAERSTAIQFLRNRIVRLMPAIWIIAPL